MEWRRSRGGRKKTDEIHSPTPPHEHNLLSHRHHLRHTDSSGISEVELKERDTPDAAQTSDIEKSLEGEAENTMRSDFQVNLQLQSTCCRKKLNAARSSGGGGGSLIHCSQFLFFIFCTELVSDLITRQVITQSGEHTCGTERKKELRSISCSGIKIEYTDSLEAKLDLRNLLAVIYYLFLLSAFLEYCEKEPASAVVMR